MRLATWNINGYRAAKPQVEAWLEAYQPDVVALQEVKCTAEQARPDPPGYRSLWFPAVRQAYSGVGLLFKREPLWSVTGLGEPEFDDEGRVLTAELEHFFLVNTYFPNAQTGGRRIDFKLWFCQTMRVFMENLRKRGKPVLLCGDLNIAHKDIDLFNPRDNQNQAGFLPAERAWLDELLKDGYRDLFREFCSEPGRYTWWSYETKDRQKNRGWRIDYWLASPGFPPVTDCVIQSEVLGSDHCPVLLEVAVPG